MGNKKGESYELEEGNYRDEEGERLRPSLDDAYKTESDESDIDELDPLNEDADPSLRKKRRKDRSNLKDETANLPTSRKSWVRRWLVPSKFCCWMIVLFFATMISLLSAGGIWVMKSAPPDGESPPWYPTPYGGTDKEWEASYKKAAELVRKLEIAEKINITTGTGWMMGPCVGNTGYAKYAGFPSLCLQDGPLGIRWADNVSAFPAGVTVGATWNKELMFQRGAAHGLEARLKGINVILGPTMGPLGRTPLGGRNWEGFGSDPVLQALASAETIKGIQSQNVIATAKHFIGNEQEHFRQSWEWGRPNAISSNIDDRTLHELYAWPFAESVRAGVGSVMCSYNQVNNSYACQNSKLMNGLLKDELGFQGFVQSDWLAQRSGVASALAGLDMSMPGDGLRWQDGNTLWGGKLAQAVFNGSVPIERLNDMVTRITATYYQMNQENKTLFPDTEPNFSSWTDDQVGLLHPGSDDKAVGVVNKFVKVRTEAHNKLARQIAAEGIVLLKNEKEILPLRRQGGFYGAAQDMKNPRFKVAIIGDDARANPDGINSCKDRGCNKGTLASGWGSGTAEFPYLVSPLEAITRFYDPKNVDITSFNGTKVTDGLRTTVKDSNLCIVFANADGGEGYIESGGIAGDRNDLFLQKDGDKFVQEAANACGSGKSPVIVVIHSIGPVSVENFVDIPNVDAILLANLPGQESGNALADVLFGDVNPSGKLPYTMGKALADYGPSAEILTQMKARTLAPQQNFSEGLLIDYRHFDFYDIEPRYEFGYGLSYTNFQLSGATVRYIDFGGRKRALPRPRPAAAVAPPKYKIALPDVRSALFPKGFRKLAKYIYPYLDDTTNIRPGGTPDYPPNYASTSVLSPAGGGPGGNPDLYSVLIEVRASLTNKGKRAGKCVVQLYISLPREIDDPETGEHIVNPVRQLRNFTKVDIPLPNHRAEIKFPITRKDLSYWSPVRQNWVMPSEVNGIKIEMGFSSRDLPVTMEY